MALNIEAIESRQYQPIRRRSISEQMKLTDRANEIKKAVLEGREAEYSIAHKEAISIDQLEAFLFVSRLNFDLLYENTLGGPLEAIKNIDNISRLLPPTPGVYFICANSLTTDKQDVIYIGMTEAGFDKRLSSSHHALRKIQCAKEYCNSILSLKYTSLYPGMDIEAIEGAAISYFDPPVNVVKTFPSRPIMEKFINRAIFLFQQDVEN